MDFTYTFNGMILPTVLTFLIIYFWFKIFGETAEIPRILIVAAIANFQNYITILILNILSFFGLSIWNPMMVIPLVVWIFLIKIFFKYVSFSHAILIGALCFATHTFFEIYVPYRNLISFFF